MVNAYINCRNMKIGWEVSLIRIPYVNDTTNEHWLRSILMLINATWTLVEKYPDVDNATKERWFRSNLMLITPYEHWLRSILMLIMLPWQRSKLQLRRGSGVKRRQISFEIVSLLHELKFAPRNDFSSSHPFYGKQFYLSGKRTSASIS